VKTNKEAQTIITPLEREKMRQVSISNQQERDPISPSQNTGRIFLQEQHLTDWN
jgi:hypothetical protein